MTCEQIRVDKSGYLTQVAQLTGNLREPSDLINPSITIEYTGLPGANYAYISGFGRYYFITNITSIATNLWRLDMHEDVLMTFRGNKNGLSSTGLYGLTAYVSRYEGAESDRNLIDTTYPLLGNATRRRYQASLSGWYGSSYFMDETQSGQNAFRYLITFNGNALDANKNILESKLIIGHILTNATGIKGIVASLQDQTVVVGNPTSYYIQSIKCFPCHLNPTNTAVSYMDVPGAFADLPVNPAMCFQTNSLFIEKIFTVSVTPSSTVNQFKNYLPYTNVSVTFAPFGRFALDNSLVFANADAAKTIYFRVACDVLSGNANLYYGTASSAVDIYLGSANIAIDVPLMSSSYSLANMISGTASAAGSVGSMLSGNPATIPGAVNGVLNMASSFDVASSSVSNGSIKIIDNGPRVDVQFHDIPDMAVSLFGRPCALNPKLGTLTGYAEIGRIHIENLASVATKDEVDEIEQLLTSGVIL